MNRFIRTVLAASFLAILSAPVHAQEITEAQVIAACSGTDTAACAALVVQLPAGSALLELALSTAASAPISVEAKVALLEIATGRLSPLQASRVTAAMAANVPLSAVGRVLIAVQRTANPAVNEEASPA